MTLRRHPLIAWLFPKLLVACDTEAPRVESAADGRNESSAISAPNDARYALLTEPETSPESAHAVAGDCVESFTGVDRDTVTLRAPRGHGSLQVEQDLGRSGEAYLARASAAAEAAGAHTLTLSGGTLRFPSPALITGVSDLRIDGNGATLVLTDNPYDAQAGIRFESYERAAIQNLGIAWAVAPNNLRLASMGHVDSQGRVALDPAPSRSLKLRAITGFLHGEWPWDRPSREASVDDHLSPV